LNIDIELKGCQIEKNNIFSVLQYQPLELISKFSTKENLELTVSLIVKKVNLKKNITAMNLIFIILKSFCSKQKEEKFAKEEIFYEGKKDFNLKTNHKEVGEIVSERIKMIFLNTNISYNVCFRCVDKIHNKVYLYKNPSLIYVKKS